MNNILTQLIKYRTLFRGPKASKHLKTDALNKPLLDLHVKCLCINYVVFRREVLMVSGWPEN